jgi:hypothetical protein
MGRYISVEIIVVFFIFIYLFIIIIFFWSAWGQKMGLPKFGEA